MSDLITEYRARLEDRKRRTVRHRRAESVIANARLGVAAVAAALALTPGVPWAWLVLPVVAFAWLAVKHEGTIRARDRALRAEAFHERGLDRLEDSWPGKGIAGERFADPDHPYSADLDVFGEGSLFELVCTARTRAGEDALAAWLTGPADGDEVRSRQEAVVELAPRLDFREELALLGEDVRAGIDEPSLTAWGRAPIELSSTVVPVAAGVLAAAAAASIGLSLATELGLLPVAATGLVLILFDRLHRRKVNRVLLAADRPAGELDLVARILGRIERERFGADRLTGLAGRLETGGDSPSRRVRGLVRLLRMADSAGNMLFAPFAFVLSWRLQIAFAIERWRRRSGRAVGTWVAAMGEFEALVSLASHAFEHPDDVFPEVVDAGPLCEGKGVTHPLLPSDRAVRNDVRLASEPALLLVSGSNMSGKSTLLRSVGANVVLALAGAPVRARSFRLSRLQAAGTIRIQDSLLAGRSRFFAEIERLKQLMDLAERDVPVLFLLDELLHGTNSHDRAVGAAAVVQGLLDRGAIGLATTHDLALSGIADGLGRRALNVHFADRIVEGKVVFDYRLRDGVVEKGNALALMRAVGLPL